MIRVLVCLPLCLILAPSQPEQPPRARAVNTSIVSKDALPIADPIAFLQACDRKYETLGIKSYALTFLKQERIAGVLQASEEIEACYREEPRGVFFKWVKGARKADSALYVADENNGMLLVHPSGIAGKLIKVVTRDPDGEEARQSGRYPMKEFGMHMGLVRILKAWTASRDAGTLQVEYLGIRKVKELNDRLCYTIKRTCAEPEEDGIRAITVYIDKESWLQVGTVLKGDEGKLVGEYLFRDLRLNPHLPADQFKSAALLR